MTRKTALRVKTNPGLPGFARFWGHQISRSAGAGGSPIFTPLKGLVQKLSLKNVLGCGPGTQSSKEPNSKTFFEESFLEAGRGQHLVAAYRALKEGTFMPSTY
jgi:hypothetical protein